MLLSRFFPFPFRSIWLSLCFHWVLIMHFITITFILTSWNAYRTSQQVIENISPLRWREKLSPNWNFVTGPKFGRSGTRHENPFAFCTCSPQIVFPSFSHGSFLFLNWVTRKFLMTSHFLPMMKRRKFPKSGHAPFFYFCFGTLFLINVSRLGKISFFF